MKRNTLRVEQLEDRAVPALFGNAWPNADRLTLSFAPDGTDVGGAPSTLFGALGAMPAAAWQGEILRAFQAWASQTNVNVGVVADSGAAFGSPAPLQGGTAFGDVRVSARPLSDNVLVVSTPFNAFDTWAGEIVLNSNKAFTPGGGTGQYDLYTALLQESGHVLGMDNSPDPNSVMYEYYGGARAGLSAGDVSGIQSLYGLRTADAFDSNKSNDFLSNASTLTFVSDVALLFGTDGTWGDKPFVAAGDLTTLTDRDSYAVKVPQGTTGFTVAFVTDGISQLRAKLTVYDANNQVVKSATVPVGQAGAFQLAVTGAQAGTTYRVRVEKADDTFAIGSYRLAVGTATAAPQAALTPAGSVSVWSDLHTNDTRSTATFLGDAKLGADARWEFTTTGSINNFAGITDVDYYKFHTKNDSPKVAVIGVWAADPNALVPTVEVYDKNGAKVAVEVLSTAGGNAIVQLAGLQANTDYYVRVAAASPTSLNQGNYGLGIDFRTTALTLPTFAAGTLQGTLNQTATTFQLSRSQVVYFEVAGTGGTDAAVRMTVYDANNVAVLSLVAKGGQVAGADALLGPGAYTVRFVAGTRDGSPLSAFQFRGRYNLGSDPIGPELTDPTAAPPVAPPQAPPTLFTYDPVTQTITAFLAPSTVYTAPVGMPGTDPLVWLAPPPPPTFFLAVQTDIYANPWW